MNCRQLPRTDIPDMKIKYSFFFLLVIVFFSCAGPKALYIPVPDENFFKYEETIGIEIDDIVQTKDGASAHFLP